MKDLTHQDKTKKPSLLYRIVRGLVKLFFPKYTVFGQEKLPDGPCIIVANHSQMAGPILGELKIPGDHFIWCSSEMMHIKEVPAYAYRDFWTEKPGWIRWFYKILSYLIAPLSVLIFNNAHTIPVYRDARLISTMRESTKKLSEGCKIVIFPEHKVPYNNIVYAFQDRFVDLARLYHRKTGKDLLFVPLYIAPSLKQMHYGDPIRYDTENGAETERARISQALMERITDLALSLPEHTVVPYVNLPKKQYLKNIPLEVFND